MSDMTEQNAPERIWVDPETAVEQGLDINLLPDRSFQFEYVRVDLYDAAWNEAIEAALAAENKRPVATPWRSDGEASKLDRCVHGMGMNEGCSDCWEEAIRALRREPNEG